MIRMGDRVRYDDPSPSEVHNLSGEGVVTDIINAEWAAVDLGGPEPVSCEIRHLTRIEEDR